MKKLLLVLMLGSFNVSAEDGRGYLNGFDSVFSVCLEGYLFAIYKGYDKGGITQIFEYGTDRYGIRPPQPMKCKTKPDIKKAVKK